MRHLVRILGVAATLAAVAYSTALTTPAVSGFLDAHPADAAYLLTVTSVLAAVWRAWHDRQTAQAVQAPASTGAATMGGR